MYRGLLFIMALSMLFGCANQHAAEFAYQQAQVSHPLRLPKHLAMTTQRQPYYAIPSGPLPTGEALALSDKLIWPPVLDGAEY